MNPYTPTAEQLGRFRQLIAHLRTMPPEQFDFQYIHKNTGCGSAGCAVGQAPILWPELVQHISQEHEIGLGYLGVRMAYWRVASNLFGMSGGDAEALFTPEMQPEELPMCYDRASVDEVADMLDRYLELYLETPAAV